ncbi:MAG: response regulator [Candidatus Marinimicrobia bacterium]|nr:response regulator [Candidatus Neomarinimicrobiota bacterium]
MEKNTKVYKTPVILIIDDEESICEFFTDLFEIYKVEIDVELSGTSGLQRARKNRYDLIFLDVMLGDMDGIDVLKAIKLNNSDTKVVMISAYLTEEIIEKALKLGADGYLYKPVSVRDIVSLTLRFIELAQ